MTNNCSNSESRSCNPCAGCEIQLTSDCVISLADISCIDTQSGDNLTDVLNALGSQLCNFYNIIDGGSGLTVEEVDGSPSYTAINTLRFNQDSGFIVTQPSANTADVRLIPTFLFPDGAYITVDMVSTGNLTLSGLQNLDLQTGIVGSRVLAWKQTIKTENGVWIQAVGSWTRATDSDTTGELNNQVVFANYTKGSTQYGGKYFNQIAVSPVIGSDNIVYQLPNSGNKQAWLLDGNDLDGVEKWLGTISNNDLPLRTNNTEKARLFKTGEVGIGITATPLAKLHIRGVGSTSSTSALLIQNSFPFSILDIKNDGSIYRGGGLLWSRETSSGQPLVTWGENAGAICSTASSATMIGFNAGASLVSGNGLTAIGSQALYLATVASNTGIGTAAGRNHTTGHSCTYIGFSAGYPAGVGDNSTGNYSTAIGTYSMIGGNFDNVLSITGVGTANNQIVIGGAININNAAFCYYDDMYIGKGVTNLTPGDIKIQGTGGLGTDIDGGDLILASARATGNGDSGDIIAKYAPPGVSGTTATTLTTGLTFKGTNGGLELSSTLGYLLLNRLTSTQRDALTAVNGMIIYNSTTSKFQGYQAGSWQDLI